MTWMKKAPDGREYNHLLKFFQSRPLMLVDCGIYRFDKEGIYFFYQRNGKIVERYLAYEILDGRPVKPTLTKLANE